MEQDVVGLDVCNRSVQHPAWKRLTVRTRVNNAAFMEVCDGSHNLAHDDTDDMDRKRLPGRRTAKRAYVGSKDIHDQTYMRRVEEVEMILQYW